jgi:hypothetical protein
VGLWPHTGLLYRLQDSSRPGETLSAPRKSCPSAILLIVCVHGFPREWTLTYGMPLVRIWASSVSISSGTLTTRFSFPSCSHDKLFMLFVCCKMKLSFKTEYVLIIWRPLWSSGQSSWLQIHRSPALFPALPDFPRSSESRTGSTQPREYNWGATWKKK